MNSEALFLQQLIETKLPDFPFTFIPNAGDPSAKPGDLLAELASPARPGRKLLLIQRGDALEIAYRSGIASDTGPAEMQFISL